MNISTSVDEQIKKGREAMVYFHNSSSRFSNYNLTFDGLLDQVSKSHPSIFLESLGFAIESLNTDGFFSGGRVKDSMEAFADRAQGRVPDNQTAFFTALSDQAQVVNWVDATGFVAKESAIKIVDGLVEVGETVENTLSGIGMILPFLAIGALIFIVVEKSKRIAAA